MENGMNKITDSTGRVYKRWGETCFHEETPDGLCRLLETLRQTGERVKIYYGDPGTGKLWLEEHETRGYIGRSTGRIKIPLLIYNSRSMGGGALLSDRILRIETTKGARVLYQAPKMTVPEYSITASDMPEYAENLYVAGVLQARGRKAGEMERLAKTYGLHLRSVGV